MLLTTSRWRPGWPRVPIRPFGTLPGTRPQTPSPALPPGWVAPARDRYEYHLRVFSERTGWISGGWHSCRQFAAVTAQNLCVGVEGHPWQWGDVWGPPRDDADRPVRTLADLIPDSLFNEPDQPHGYARMPT